MRDILKILKINIKMDDSNAVPDSDSLLDEQYQSPEYLQKKLYFLLEQLKIMHNELPE